MPSDLPPTPNDEDLDVISKVFAETRASTLVSQTSAAPKPEITANSDANAIDNATTTGDASANATASATAGATEDVNGDANVGAAQPQTSGEIVAAPASQVGEAKVEVDAKVADAPSIEVSAPIVDSAPDSAEDSTLSLSFAPAPDAPFAPFQSSVTVGIACQSAGAAVYYTLDGTAPDATSMRYTPEKILLTQSATLSARAFVGDRCGPICSAGYVVAKPLWQENEPADSTDATPHQISENRISPDGWQVAAASVRGKLHAHRALWREDSFALGDIPVDDGAANGATTNGDATNSDAINGGASDVAMSSDAINGDTSDGAASGAVWEALLVSDGAGSAPLSRVGSRVACESALQSLRATLPQIGALSDDAQTLAAQDLPRLRAALVRAASDALAALQSEAQTRNQPLSAFAATLLVLVRRAWNERQLCAAIQIGDGAIALDCQSGLKLLGVADHGQHSSETRFLTTKGIEAELAGRVIFSLPDDLRATLLVSDGVSDDYFPEDKRLTEVFEAVVPLAQNAADAGAALLKWLGYEKKGSSDDRTIVLSWPAQPGAVATLEAELDAAENEMAGLAPSSNLEENAATRLEEGGSPAPETPTPETATSNALESRDGS